MHLDAAALDAGLPEIRRSPTDEGTVDMIVRRPDLGARQSLEEGALSTEVGLVGDTWAVRPSRRTADGSPHPDMQLNLINARLSSLVAGGDDEQRALAGDQLHLDLDRSIENLPPGTRLGLGTAVIEVTDQPHTGCPKFRRRFGAEALHFVSHGEGAERRLRGINAKVVRAGTIRVGDIVGKL